jgi:tripartite-type tricarboxylate transporter receptor subunit TctC
MQINRIVRCTLLVAVLLIALRCHAGDFPDKPLRMVIAYAPGGSTDAVGRLFAKELSSILGQSIVVENRGGGGTLLGTDSVRRAAPDGYSLLYGTNALVITPLLHNEPTYNALKDFSPVGLATMQSLGLFMSPRLGIKTVPELIAYAKANPGKVNFASSSTGSGQHLAGEAFKLQAGIDIVHVPYKGAGPAMIDLLAGRVDMMFTSLMGVMDHVAAGRLVLLATTGATRNTGAPEVPTVAEGGLPNFATYTWQGILAPAGTPAPIIKRLNQALRQAAEVASIRSSLEAQGFELKVSSPEGLHEQMQSDYDLYKKLLERANQTTK